MNPKDQPNPAPRAAEDAAMAADPRFAGLDPAARADGDDATRLDLTAQLEKALTESAQTKDALLRALADAENIRKRSTADVASAHKYAIENFANNLLPVKDTLEMAVADTASSVEQMRMGVDLTLKNLVAAFEKAKISEVNPLGQKFDPTKHQAVSHVESDQPANTVVQVFQKGYVLQDRVLRPAMVAVAKGPSAAEAYENPVESAGI
jgi:molecular chaperone GrpE